jgi:uncharacterized protein DUF3224
MPLGPRLLLLSVVTFSLTANSEGLSMPSRASGTFDVTIAPLGTPDKAEGATLGRMSLAKQLQGDLTGTSKGEMLTAMTDTKGSAGYVAIERVSGTLQGRSGTFVLQHIGTMTQGAQQMTIKVVPDSATGQLTGLSGTMTITIVDGKHFYEFDYVLPPQ